MLEIIRPEIHVSSFDKEATREIIEKLNAITTMYPPTQGIIVNIDTEGGDVYGLSEIYETLISMPNDIITYTSSKAMSAGTILLSAAGNPGMRVGSPNSVILLHELQSAIFGDIKEIENSYQMINMMNDKWMTILAKSMKMGSREDIKNLLKNADTNDLYLNPEQAKALGIIDEIGYCKMQPYSGYDIFRLSADDVAKKHQVPPEEQSEPTYSVEIPVSKPKKKSKKK